MASEPQAERIPRTKRVPLGTSRRRLSFERRLRLWLRVMGLPGLLLLWLLLRTHAGLAMQVVWLLVFAAGWALAVSLLTEQITRPLQTLANVVSALREDDYSFRARGARRNDALGDLAIEVNALASMLQGQRAGALEAMALVERVINAMQSPVVAFDPEGRLKLLNPAGERAFGLDTRKVIGQTAAQLRLEHLLEARDDELLSLEGAQQAARWVVKRAGFRLRGIPHTLLVLADVSAALREEERQAWERLIRVLGHEINNSLTPIKSIAASLRGRLEAIRSQTGEDGSDFVSGLEVIESRAESLNRFLQAYRQLMGLPVPRLAPVSLEDLVDRVARLETRLAVTVTPGTPATLIADNDQLQQALINLVRNAVDAAESPDSRGRSPQVEMTWEIANNEVIIAVLDSGPGLSNAANLFVPFYTTKPNGTGIGLVLAQQIAQAHRGSVQLVNRANGVSGCRAELRLPLHPPSA
jgi:two-component system, NtrC family, nitrogen regulation sensor histidine kinase NtrY